MPPVLAAEGQRCCGPPSTHSLISLSFSLLRRWSKLLSFLGRISDHGEKLERSLNMCFHTMFLFELTELLAPPENLKFSAQVTFYLVLALSLVAVALSYAITLQPSRHNTALQYTTLSLLSIRLLTHCWNIMFLYDFTNFDYPLTTFTLRCG